MRFDCSRRSRLIWISLATWAFDEKRMSVSRYEDQAYEYRLTIATAGTLALCALGLVAVTILFAAGDRFEYRPSVSNITQPDDNLVRSFESLESATRRREAGISGSRENNTTPAASSPQDGAAPDSTTHHHSCSAQNWPYSAMMPFCGRAAEAPASRGSPEEPMVRGCSPTPTFPSLPDATLLGRSRAGIGRRWPLNKYCPARP